MVGNRVIEIIAGVAAVVFLAAMLWMDFSSDDGARDYRWRRHTARPIQYASAVIALAGIVVLGVRG